MVSGQVDCCTVFTRGCLTCLLICFFEESLLPHDINSDCVLLSRLLQIYYMYSRRTYSIYLPLISTVLCSRHWTCSPIPRRHSFVSALVQDISVLLQLRLWAPSLSTSVSGSTFTKIETCEPTYYEVYPFSHLYHCLLYLVSFLTMLWKVLKFTAM